MCESLKSAPATEVSGSGCESQFHKPSWSVLSNGKPTAQHSTWRGWKRKEWARPLSGLTWRALLTSWLPGYQPDSLISFARESRASRGQWRGSVPGWPMSGGFGSLSGESSVSCGRGSSSSKTSQVFGVAVDSLPSSVTLHGSGTMRNGIVSQRWKSVRTTGENGSGFWPTSTNGTHGTDFAKAGRTGSGGDDLQTAIARSMLQTPCASDAAGSRSTKGSKRPAEGGLRKQAMLSTPRAEDSQATGAHRGKPDTLNSAVRQVPTPKATMWSEAMWMRNKAERFASPQANDWKSGTGFTPDGQHTPQLRHTAGGMLNPTWVGWLMGVPLGWDALPLMRQSALSACMPWAMESYLSRQRWLLCNLPGEEDGDASQSSK